MDDHSHPLPNNQPAIFPSLSEIIISSQDVKDAISLIDPSKASGPDLVSPNLLKKGVNELSGPLSKFFTRLLLNSEFPSQWKRANVAPVFKKSDPSTPSNYRPISLLSCLGKVMERCVHKYLYNYVVSNEILTKCQSGFIKGDSTTNQLLFLYNDIVKALDEGKEVKSVFCDISKAFDRVWHRGLLFKLESIGIKDSLLSWIRSYLRNRHQRVVIANATSNWSAINAGVPQGSILGPLLFLIYINDIVSDIEANVRLFADDTSLYIIVDDPTQSSVALNSDLSHILSWSKRWLVSFNPAKTESLIFSRKRNKPQHPALLMDNVPITKVNNHKHLGLTLSDDAKWNSHIKATTDKAWKRIGLLRSLKFVLSRFSLEKMYISFIRPLLEYGDTIWDNCSQELKNDIEAVQIEAARIVTGATKLCNTDRLISELRWDTLSERRRKHRLTVFYKMKNHLTPSYLSDLVPKQNRPAYNLRSTHDVPAIHTRTTLYGTSFLPKTIREWNELSPVVRNSPSLPSFKNKIHGVHSKSNPLYNVGGRKQQINHARLRLGCSSLNFDLYRRNIVETDLCACGSVETANHFLLHCPSYRTARDSLFSNLSCPPTSNCLLFGDERLSFESNKAIFLNVQKYIDTTKRFSTG